jgi:hypothetical protein
MGLSTSVVDGKESKKPFGMKPISLASAPMSWHDEWGFVRRNMMHKHTDTHCGQGGHIKTQARAQLGTTNCKKQKQEDPTPKLSDRKE